MTPALFYGKMPEILVADDTLNSLRLISESLSSHGYEVRSVPNGTLALASVQAAQPDLILLDIKMPDLSGYEVCEQLKADPKTQDIPIIFLSALHEPFDKVQAFAVGGVDYITKPFHVEEALARIQSQLAWHFSLTQTQRINDELEERVKERTAQLTLANQALKQENFERQQIEQNLRESEAKFRQISEHIQEVFWLSHYDYQEEKFTHVEYVSPQFEEIWGCTRQSLYQNFYIWIEGIHPEERPRVEMAFMKGAIQGDYDQEYRIIRPDGTIRWIRDRGFPIYNDQGQVYRVAGIAEDITSLKKAEQTSRLLASVVQSSNDAIITKNLQGVITSWNAGAVNLFGYTQEEVIGQSIFILIPADRKEEEEYIIRQLKKSKTINNLETIRLHKNGKKVEVSVTISPLKNEQGKVIGASKIVRNITRRKQVERERDRFFNLSLDLLFISNDQGFFKRLNPAWLEVLGYQTEELLGQSFWTLLHPEDRRVAELMQQQLQEGKEINSVELRCRHQDGSYIWIAWNIVPFPQERLLYGAGRNISERKKSEARLVHQTLHDSLTGLANRAYFMQRLEIILKQTKRNPKKRFAVLFIDLDDFKRINDTLGHCIGDLLLMNVSEVLKTSVREIDLVARLGGDEFTILLEEIYHWTDVLKVVERIKEQLKSSFQLESYEIFTSASIGIVFSQPDYEKVSDIIRDADIAMYRAKANGKGDYEVFDREMYAQTLHWVELENDLRYAIDNQGLDLYYQPIVNLRDSENVKLEGFEVLLRWHHPQKGLIPASEFIPIAEDTGLINKIGAWVLREACLKFQFWCSLYPEFSHLYFSVNISGCQLREDSLLDILDSVLEETQICGQSLKLEITESSLIKNTEIAVHILKAIQDRGIHISLDDFGTGFSSLRYLHQFPIDVIKIDKSFVKTIHQGHRERSIIHSIITLARTLGFSTVAEGIESHDQLEELQRLECDSGQGYFFSKPMSNQQLHRFLRDQGFVLKSTYCCPTTTFRKGHGISDIVRETEAIDKNCAGL